MKIYLVGGAVRDKLLNRSIHEKDYVVVGATVDDMLAQGFKPVGKDFPVFLHPKTHEEYALARTEKKVSKGYTGFEFHAHPDVSLVEDLKRRDLTINAMALSISPENSQSNEIIDPFNGQKDLKNKIIRHVSPAFSEDPVRILRVARFMARFKHLGFSIAPETLKLMGHMVVAGEVDALVPERVWQELHKALQEQSPEAFFQSLRDCGALEKLFPEMNHLFGVPSKAKYHPEIDSGIHTLMVLQQAAILSKDPEIRFAAAVHDLGKAITPMNQWPSHKGHEIKSIPLVKALCKRFKVPKSFTRIALITAQYHDLVHKALEIRASTVLDLLEKTDAFRRPKAFEKMLIASEADSKGRLGFEAIDYPQKEFLLKALACAKTVDVKSLIAQGYEQEALIEQIRQQRIKLIKKVQQLNLG